MADGETFQDTCLETVIILAFLSGDASDKEIAHFPCEIKYKLLYCVFLLLFFVDTEAKAIMKERQKKDSHNLSEFDFLQSLPAVSVLSLRTVITMCTWKPEG